jgi:hypothetical protein
MGEERKWALEVTFRHFASALHERLNTVFCPIACHQTLYAKAEDLNESRKFKGVNHNLFVCITPCLYVSHLVCLYHTLFVYITPCLYVWVVAQEVGVRGEGGGAEGSPQFLCVVHQNYAPGQLHRTFNTLFNPGLKPCRSIPLLGSSMDEEGLGAWLQICIRCPLAGHRSIFWHFPANDSKLPVYDSLHYLS